MKRFKKLILGSGVVVALTASFAFKAVKQQSLIVSGWNPLNSHECVSGYDANQNDCTVEDTGPRCTFWYSSAYPNVPAFTNTEPECTQPLYQDN